MHGLKIVIMFASITLCRASSPDLPEITALAAHEEKVVGYLETAKKGSLTLAPITKEPSFLSQQISDHMPFIWSLNATLGSTIKGFTWNIMGEGCWHGFMDTPSLCNHLLGETYGPFVAGRSSLNESLSGPYTEYSGARLKKVKDVLSHVIASGVDILCLQEISSSFFEQLSTFSEAFSIHYKKIDDDSWKDGAIKMDYGVVTMVRKSLLRAIVELTVTDETIGRVQFLQMELATGDVMGLLNVHLPWSDPTKEDVVSPVIEKLLFLRGAVQIPLLITGDFNRDMSRMLYGDVLPISGGSIAARPHLEGSTVSSKFN
jgi:hypothetical protein